jgi:methylated-DNA-protein-cysteine methyltransferase related protein
MAKSAAFARIKADVLRIVQAIPAGKVLAFADIGRHLDVAPRHVAYILTMLPDAEKALIPWHRVVGESGALGKPKFDADGVSQAELLRAEGHVLEDGGALLDMPRVTVALAKLKSGVPRQTRLQT